MSKKIKKVQLFRHLVQLISFFLFPGFFILAFGELKYIYQSLINEDLNILQTMSMSIELILVILFTIILGRFFCGWICAFGTFNDFIYGISKKIFKTKFRINEKFDSKLKYLKYVILLSIIAFSWTIGYSFFEYSSPWEAFAQITDFSGVLSNFAIGLALLVLITIGAFFIERFFCRYLCPLGAIFTIISKLSIFNIDMPKYGCSNRNCKACTNNCSMGIPLSTKSEITGGECINCLSCIEICPSKNAKATILNMQLSRTLAVSIAFAAVVGFYAFYSFGSSTSASTMKDTSSKYTVSSSNNGNSITQENSISDSSNTPSTTTIPNHSGTNNSEVSSNVTPSTSQDHVANSGGTASGSEDTTQTDSGNISSSKNDTSNPISSVKANTNTKGSSSANNTKNANSSTSASTKPTTSSTTKQNNTTKSNTSSSTSTNTGANTSTSTASKNASTSTSTNTKINSNTSTNNNTSSANTTAKVLKYKNGTYSGSGIGFRGGTTTVSVTISNDKIINLETTYSEDTPRFYERVEYTMFDEIMSSQSTSVDTISGATYSCDGITAAVEDALNKALANSGN
jgi:polyferredoxin/uncharacterized protein with FMN-binding domain